MLMICIIIYIIATLLSLAFFWAALVVAKRNDIQSLESHFSPAESVSEV
jgi:hypothetical protein